MKTKPPLWTLEEALWCVRKLQPFTRRFNYHLTLGGGVLNMGTSNKDLDLFFLPLDNGKECDPNGLLLYLMGYWRSDGEPIGSGEEYLNYLSAYHTKWKFATPKRIDVFIMKGE